MRGRLVSIDSLWEVSGKVLEAGRNERSRLAVTFALAEADNFGICENGQRLPGFFGKEILTAYASSIRTQQ